MAKKVRPKNRSNKLSGSRSMRSSSGSWDHKFRESDMTLWVNITGNPRHQIAMAVGIWANERYPQYELCLCNKESFERVKSGD